MLLAPPAVVELCWSDRHSMYFIREDGKTRGVRMSELDARFDREFTESLFDRPYEWVEAVAKPMPRKLRGVNARGEYAGRASYNDMVGAWIVSKVSNSASINRNVGKNMESAVALLRQWGAVKIEEVG